MKQYSSRIFRHPLLQIPLHIPLIVVLLYHQLGRQRINHNKSAQSGRAHSGKLWLKGVQFITLNTHNYTSISSQVGCSLNCSFCRTGTQKLLRNLTAEEIFTQVMHAMHTLEAFPRSPTLPNPVNNIVLMGQGEPLYNYRAVAQAVKNMIHHLKISPHRITLSTSGVASLIPKIASDLGISLAVSLHATNNRLRDLLVPLNKTYDISTVIKAVDEYTALSSNTIASPRHRRVTFEYVMLNDVNDSLLEAKALIKLIRHLPSPHVNLMAFNPWQGSGFSASPSDRIEAFAAVLKDAGADTTVRKSRGKDIDAACGQLKSREEVKKRGSL